MDEPKKSNAVMISSVAVLIVAIIGFTLYKFSRKEATVAGVPIETPVETPIAINTPPTITNKYKDGTYSATGTYQSPGGTEGITVSLTIKDDVITDATAETQAARPESLKFQGLFKANFKGLVVGKKIDEVNLSKVSGSSLTSGGFNDAVAKIKLEAKA